MNPAEPPFPLGACLDGDRASFCVWAPTARFVDVELTQPVARTVRLDAIGAYHAGTLEGVAAGTRYGFRLDGGPLLPDPVSRHQPDGVHGPSAVVDSDFPWTDRDWRGVPLRECVFYELHIGTFTPDGTLAAATERIPELRDLGVTTIELMPVAQFPGTRNWGYDGVFPYAVQDSYGGPLALKQFVDACHAAGLAVCLDVVYNHLGPDGNYLAEFGPYFTDRYRTPWGNALNFDGAHSDHVREYFIANALQWVDEFHIDVLRLDAVHAILDQSAQPFLRELADRVRERAGLLGRRILLIAESDLGDPALLRPATHGGMGLDGQWLDDFHHALHTILTGEQDGYYRDFGTIEVLARTYRDRFAYAGQYSEHRQRRHGAPADDLAAHRFVVYAQNHDQVGNRRLGDRLTRALTLDQLKLAATAVLLSPFTPMLFMGEEYGETAPFPYFVSHTDAPLVEAVRRGRAEEFAAFAWAGEPPDPQAEETFRSAVLNWASRREGEHGVLLDLHRELLRVRRELAPLRADGSTVEAVADSARSLLCVRFDAEAGAQLYLHFGATPVAVDLPDGEAWRLRLDTAAARWNGPGRIEPDVVRGGGSIELPPHSALLLKREKN